MKSPRVNAGSEATSGESDAGSPGATGGSTPPPPAAGRAAGAGSPVTAGAGGDASEAGSGEAAPQNGQAGALSEMRLPHAAHVTSTCPPDLPGESSHKRERDRRGRQDPGPPRGRPRRPGARWIRG